MKKHKLAVTEQNVHETDFVNIKVPQLDVFDFNDEELKLKILHAISRDME